MKESISNWAGNYTFSADKIHYPTTLEQIQEIVSRANQLRVLGSGHSFNDIADSSSEMLCLSNFNQPLDIDREHHTVTVGAGVKYGQFCEQLDQAGYALHNLASLPHISVAGACATATHGSGVHNGNLATAVAAIEVVTANGEVKVWSREQEGEEFWGAVVGLGALGVVTKVTLDVVPAFQMRQVVYEDLALTQLENHFGEIMGSAYSVSLFTNWQNKQIDHVWIKSRVTSEAEFEATPAYFGAKLARRKHHPIDYLSAEPCTEQLGIPGRWYERLPHFRMDFTPSSGEELQTEYYVPAQLAVAALNAVVSLQDKIAPLLQVSEIRTIAADSLWMSPCYQQERVAFHFTWKKDWEAVRQLLPLIEAQLEPFGGVPHWGKVFTMPGAHVQSLYPKLPDFRQLLHKYDPQGKFYNAFLDTYVGR